MKKFLENLKILYWQLSTKKEQIVARLLFNYSLTIATAESCTGGLISSRLTNISGSSNFVKENYVTYSIDSKVNCLGVDRELIVKYGVVSAKCAQAMAEGLFNRTKQDICLAITGVAGPTVSSSKPAGTAFISIKTQHHVETKEIRLNPHLGRRTLKFLFSEAALDFLIDFINTNYAAIISANKS